MDACNIAATLPRLARERPDQVAMRCPGRSGRYDVWRQVAWEWAFLIDQVGAA